jgi:hypothetical protein
MAIRADPIPAKTLGLLLECFVAANITHDMFVVDFLDRLERIVAISQSTRFSLSHGTTPLFR